jgi:hypothetical protein
MIMPYIKKNTSSHLIVNCQAKLLNFPGENVDVQQHQIT